MIHKKLLVFFIIFSLVVFFTFFLFIVFKPKTIDITKIKVEESFSTKELLIQFERSDKKIEKFIEKAIEIEGEIKEITYREGKHTIILKEGVKKTYVLCEMQKNQSENVLKLKVGEKIKIRGVLKGFLIDIILLNCIIL